MIFDGPGNMLGKLAREWARRMGSLAKTAEKRMYLIASLWAAGFGLLAFARISISHFRAGGTASHIDFLLYALLALAPLAALRLADLTFPRYAAPWHMRAQTSRAGRWARLDSETARAHPSFGTTGLLAALTLGLLGNIGFRCGEFLIAMPPVALDGPAWARILFLSLMLDAIVFSIAYGFAFVMAVRHAPAFPRLLMMIWLADLAAQILIAQALATASPPAQIGTALVTLLMGNLKKTLITVTIWLPYLLVSTRVNVTFRHRILSKAAI